ncbi:MAG: M55 family metallopeptidase [Cellvibrionales bacterium]|mgnify:CR=1 FL=1|jgi:D-amino peptidase|nr:M55 family metallopeptidase [Cellvibrionales bacterium]
MSAKRLYISADIEGVAGVATGEHTMPAGFEYQQAREWYTAEVLAACNAAFEEGIEEIVISDSHGNGQSLLIDKLPDNVQLIRSWPRPLCMMEGVDIGQYVGALLIGYHSGASDMRGVLAHTLHGGAISEVRLNGQVASETVISAATAAHYGVPLIMVSGCDAYIEHAKSVLPGVEGVTTKWVCSHSSARMIKPSLVQQHIANGVKAALSRIESYTPKRIPDVIETEIVCKSRLGAQLFSYLPNVDQVDAHTIKFVGQDMVEVSKFLQFAISSGALTPK